MVKVKICGIRTLPAAQAAINAGADFLGFNFVPSSKRYIDPKLAKIIIQCVRSYFSSEERSDESRSSRQARTVKIVGVFQDAEVNYINDIAANLSLDLVQLHGNESNDFCRKVTTSVIKAFRLPNTMKQYNATYYMIDREKQGEGGMVNLDKARELAEKFPLFFSGGLTPDNVLQVVNKVKPFAVDVASGVETDGVQDMEKIKLFILRAKR